MKLTQNWVGYLDRSYEQIKRSLLSRLSAKAPEISDHTETNPLIIILEMFAGVAETINLYVDSLSREIYLATARRFTSVVRIAKLIDYDLKARNYATADILFTLVDDTNTLIANPVGNILIPKGTIIQSPNSNTTPFILEKDVVLRTGFSNVYGTVAQYENVLNEVLGSSTGSASQRIQIGDDYANGTMRITIDGIDWVRYDSFGPMQPTTKGYIIDITEDNEVFVVFGDGVKGAIPTAGLQIIANYKVTQGVIGNLPPNTLTSIVSTLVTPAGLNIKVTNPDYASGGTDFETIDEIRNRAPRSLRTLKRAVSYQDYKDIALMVPGVGAAEVGYCCGKFINIYVAPNSAGVATPKLIEDVDSAFAKAKMVTTFPKILPSGNTKIWVKANIYGKPLYSEEDIYNDIIQVLDENYGFGAIAINRKFSVSDITNFIENLPSVDRTEIQQVRILPFARTIEETLNKLNLEFTGVPVSANRHTYTIRYKASPNNFDIYRDSVYLTSINVDTNYTDAGIVTFKVLAGTYDDNDSWEFVVFPSYPEIFPNTLFNINDFSAPIMEIDPFISSNITRDIFSELTIITQGASASSLPPCD